MMYIIVAQYQLNKSTSNGTSFYINHYSAGDVCMATGGGNVGIGTMDPGSYKLNVNGNINWEVFLYWWW